MNADTILCYQSDNFTQLMEAIYSDLVKLDAWLQGHTFSLNARKTHTMLISTKQKHNILEGQTEILELKVRNDKLDVVQTTKYLGIEINSFLDWQ